MNMDGQQRTCDVIESDPVAKRLSDLSFRLLKTSSVICSKIPYGVESMGAILDALGTVDAIESICASTQVP